MSAHKLWRPPLKSSLSMPANVEEISTKVRRKRFSRKQSFQSTLPIQNEVDEGLIDHKEKTTEAMNQLVLENEEDSKGNVKSAWRRLRTHKKEQPIKDTQLLKAIRENDIELIEKLINSGSFSADEEDENNLTPFLYACQIGHMNAVLALIKLGCDVASSNSNRFTALHSAAKYGSAQIVSFILQQGILPDTREKLTNRTAIHEAAFASDEETLKIMVEKLKDDPWDAQRILRLSDKKGRTALHLAAYSSLTNSIDLLLSAGADVAATDDDDLTPMHANLLGHRGKRRCGGVITQLLEAGGDVEIVGGSNDERLTHFASRVGCASCLDFLHKKGADLEAMDNQGRTPLHVAALEDQAATLMYLISNGVNIEALTKKQETPLHLAVMGDGSRVIEELLSAGADPKRLDQDEKSYVQTAILRRKRQAFDTLVRLKAVHLPDEAEEDVLHYCTALGFYKLVVYLIENGWDINLKDGRGRSPLHVSLNHGHEHIATMLINMDAGVHVTDASGATPLHYAVRWGGSDAILRLLMKKNARLAVQDRLGRTPLHYAASKFSIMSDLYILLDGGSAINTKDNTGMTPLHLAARLGNESLVRILLEKGAKHDITDMYNFLPIDHAKENNHKSIMKRLRNHDAIIHPENYTDTNHQQDDNDVLPASERRKEHRKSVAW